MSSIAATNDPGAHWMLRYQAGDEAAFDRLVELYSGKVFALLTRYLGPVAQREDLVQETFLRVIRARDRYEPRARFSTWLYRIVFNLCVNERERGSGRDSRTLEAVEQQAGGDSVLVDERVEPPSHGLEREDTIELVRRAIEALPPRQRMALILAKYEGLSYDEVARALDSTEKAIKSTIHRARESLRVALAHLVEERNL